MGNSISDETKKGLTDNDESQSGLLKTFPGFTQILRWAAESQNRTIEGHMQIIRGQCSLTIRPHDEVMKEILDGVEWSEEDDQEEQM